MVTSLPLPIRPKFPSARALFAGLLAAGALLLALGCGAEKENPTNEGAPPGTHTGPAECDPQATHQDAHIPAGALSSLADGDGEGDAETVPQNAAILTNGRKVSPVGEVAPLARFAWGLALSPDGRFAYTSNASGTQCLKVFDLEKSPIEEIQSLCKAKEWFFSHGMAVAPNGTLYASGGGGEYVNVLRPNEDGTLTREDPIQLVGYIGAVAIDAGSGKLYAVSHTQSTLFEVDLASGDHRSLVTGNYPYAAALWPAHDKVLVSNWAGGNVAVVDLASWSVESLIPVGKNPEGLALSPDGTEMWVTNSDSDSVSVIRHTGSAFEVSHTLDIAAEQPELKMFTPNAIAFFDHPDGARAYVASADHNAIEVFDVAGKTLLGSIPTAWYPVGVQVFPDGERIAVVNAKGFGVPMVGGVSDRSDENLGLLQVAPLPADADELAAHTETVRQNTERALTFYPDLECGPMNALPINGGETPIRHVVFVIKENKTYDEVLGDLVGPEGDAWHDPSLAVNFGEQVTLDGGETVTVTPNAHAIARTWVDMVNYYADAEVSMQGHMWVTQNDANDFLEKTRFDLLSAVGIDPATITENKSIFDHLYDNGVNFRVYGEVVNFAMTELRKWRDKIDLKYPYWSQGQTDVQKAHEIIREWSLAEETGEPSLFPPFVFILLPNDHTRGGKAGSLSPRTMVSDNDHGLGILVEWLSHSSYWESTLMVVIQDDPQSSVGDHIDSHRSVCYLISPWIKRGYRSTVHYSIPSVFRTIETILGIPPLNRNSALAPPMADVFTDTPDLTPYTAITPTMPVLYNAEDKRLEEESKQWDWSTFDGHEGLGSHIWRTIQGDKPMPSHAKRIDD